MEKAWLSEHEVSFTNKNVVADPKAMEELEALGVFSTPVTVIDGEIIIGFDRNRLSELLGL